MKPEIRYLAAQDRYLAFETEFVARLPEFAQMLEAKGGDVLVLSNRLFLYFCQSPPSTSLASLIESGAMIVLAMLPCTMSRSAFSALERPSPYASVEGSITRQAQHEWVKRAFNLRKPELSTTVGTKKAISSKLHMTHHCNVRLKPPRSVPLDQTEPWSDLLELIRVVLSNRGGDRKFL